MQAATAREGWSKTNGVCRFWRKVTAPYPARLEGRAPPGRTARERGTRLRDQARLRRSFGERLCGRSLPPRTPARIFGKVMSWKPRARMVPRWGDTLRSVSPFPASDWSDAKRACKMREFPDPPKVHYTPDTVNRYYPKSDDVHRSGNMWKGVCIFIGICCAVGGLIALAGGSFGGLIVGWLLFAVFVGIGAQINEHIVTDINTTISDRISEENRQQRNLVVMTHSNTEKISHDVEYLRKVAAHADRVFVNTGSIIAHAGSVINTGSVSGNVTTNVYRDIVTEEINNTKLDNPKLADAISMVGSAIDLADPKQASEAKIFLPLTRQPPSTGCASVPKAAAPAAAAPPSEKGWE